MLLLWGAIAVPAFAQAATADQSATEPADAVRGIVRAFERHPVVAIGEAHLLKQAGEFYIGDREGPRLGGSAWPLVVCQPHIDGCS